MFFKYIEKEDPPWKDNDSPSHETLKLGPAKGIKEKKERSGPNWVSLDNGESFYFPKERSSLR